jgi:hypothetical protein
LRGLGFQNQNIFSDCLRQVEAVPAFPPTLSRFPFADGFPAREGFFLSRAKSMNKYEYLKVAKNAE